MVRYIFTTIIDFLDGTKTDNDFRVDGDKFKLFVNDNLVSESEFNIIQPDKYFNEEYVILHDLETIKKYRGHGYATTLIEEIFKYVKNDLGINIISLIVYKENEKAVNLYFKTGFEVFMEYEDSYSLVKYLHDSPVKILSFDTNINYQIKL